MYRRLARWCVKLKMSESNRGVAKEVDEKGLKVKYTEKTNKLK